MIKHCDIQNTFSCFTFFIKKILCDERVSYYHFLYEENPSPIGLIITKGYKLMVDSKLEQRSNFLDAIYDLKMFCSLLVGVTQNKKNECMFFAK